LASKKKRTKETATSEKNTTASTDKEEDTTEQGTSTEAIHNESKVMFSETNPDAIFWNFRKKTAGKYTFSNLLCSVVYCSLPIGNVLTNKRTNILITYMFLL
jgi:hypothetical protein